ncbi:expansin EXLX1 family cellulose-binding protein [Archangium sp.]|uniref:expansin EXLX1 family cellulose-binding protein n=1 Tax=Archangium sp. TaxID=1872627 RepID=UPI002D4C8B04|nr:expansin EXLX1 family cellulose-binding protein [Archangium sp.]HYO51871.1 expansin EXLX1 family cellulose-binding protein [Archangium sp.]
MHINTHHLARSCVTALLLSLAACGPDSSLDPKAGDESVHVEGELASAPLGDFRSGLITYYNATGAGSCSFDASPEDLDVAAIAERDYAGSAVCGSCAEVQGPLGTVRVRIVDVCPGCTTAGHLDLSSQAFAKIARPIDGRVPVRWRFVSCPVTGPIRYRFKEGSNPWWTALQVRNHARPIQKLEWWNNGQWVAIQRLSYNYFVQSSGMGSGSIRIRVTASNGQVLEDTLPGIRAGQTLDGRAQFTP